MRKNVVLGVGLVLTCAGPAAVDGFAQQYGDGGCVIAGQPPETLWEAYGSFALAAKNSSEAWDDLSVFDFGGAVGLAYLQTDWGGDFDLRFDGDLRVLQGFDGTSSGYALWMLRLPFEYTQRFSLENAIRVDLAPGLYSDLKDISGKDFAVPFGIAGIRSVTEELSILLGMKVYPGFHRTVLPHVGLRWVPAGLAVIDLFYPESKIEFDLTPGFGMHLGLQFLPWQEWQMEDDDLRDRLRFDESRFYGGVHFASSEYSQIRIDVGYAFNREIDFEEQEVAVDIDDAPYFGFAYRSLF